MIREEEAKILINEIEKEFKINNMMRSSREREYVDARRVLFYILRDNFGITLSDIGRWSNRNHATILHATKHFKGIIEYDKGLNNIYEKVSAKAIALCSDPVLRRNKIKIEINTLKEEYLIHTKTISVNNFLSKN